MKKQVYNPYLPSYEYIPDGEPYVFDGRLYIYGSHDRFDGTDYCQNDYVCWSAPEADLSDWRYEGVIYKKSQHPYEIGTGNLYAPDVTRGLDGKYYLYYSVAGSSIISVAVCGNAKTLETAKKTEETKPDKIKVMVDGTVVIEANDGLEFRKQLGGSFNFGGERDNLITYLYLK